MNQQVMVLRPRFGSIIHLIRYAPWNEIPYSTCCGQDQEKESVTVGELVDVNCSSCMLTACGVDASSGDYEWVNANLLVTKP